MSQQFFKLTKHPPQTKQPSADCSLDQSNLLQLFSKPQQQQLHDHSNFNQAIKALKQCKDIEIIINLIKQSQQYRPTWYFPTGIQKLLAIRRCGLSSRDDLFAFLLAPNQIQLNVTLQVIKQRFLKTFRSLCHSEIFQRKLDYESRDTSTLKPYRTKMGTLFMRYFFKEVIHIEQQAKTHWVNQRTHRLRQRAFTY